MSSLIGILGDSLPNVEVDDENTTRLKEMMRIEVSEVVARKTLKT